MKKSFITVLAFLWTAGLVLVTASSVFANASVTTLANANMSADTAGGTYTALTGPVVTEGANRDIGTGAIVLNPPSGFAFNPVATVSAVVARVSGTGTPVTLSAATGTVTTSTITITVTAQDTFGTTLSSIAWSGIQVRPTAGTPLTNGIITKAIGGAGMTGINSGTTNFGTLVELAGAANKLGFTTQPTNITAGVTMGNFIVQVQDRFTNAVAQSGIPVTLTLNGSTLFSGTNPQITVTNGKATFNDFVIRQAGTNLNFTTTNSGTLTNSTSANFNITAAAAAAINVETAANGTGSTVGAQNITSGASLQVFAITRDAFGNFVANPSSTWSLTNRTGGVVAGDLTPTTSANSTFTGHLIGSAAIHVVNGSLSTNSATLTVVPGAITKYVVSATTPQTRGTAFPVTVTAQDTNANTVTGNSSTVVTMTSSTGNALFDGSGDNSFANNTQTLSSGTFTINAKDSTVESLTITGTDGNGKTGTSGSITVNPVTGDYRSFTTGNWDTAGSWQTWNGTAWVTASTPPTGTSGINITILSGTTITLRTQTGTLILNGNLSVLGGLTLNASTTLQIGSGGTVGLLSGSVANNGALVFNHSDAVVYSGAVSGTGTLMNQGAGTLTLNSANTYSGDTRIAAGTLVLGNSSALQNTALDMNSADNGTLGFGTLTTATFGGLKGSRNVALQTASTAPVTLIVGNNAASTVYSGVLSGSGSVTKIGTGALTLSGNNTFSGSLLVEAGTVSIPTINNTGVAGPLGQGTTPVTLGWTNAVGTLEYTGATGSSTRPFAVGTNGDTAAFGAVVQVDTAGTVLTLSGQINQINVAYLTKTGPGTLVLAGTDDNIGLGVIASTGTVVAAKTSSSNVHAFGGAGFTLGGATVQLGGTGGDQVYDLSFVTVNTGTFDFNGLSETLPAITGSGGKILNNGGGASVMTVGIDNGSRTYSGAIADNSTGSGTMSLVKVGTGVQTLTGTNTYTGPTTVKAGGVTLDGSTGHLADNSGATFAGTGSFNYDNTGAGGSISETVGTLTLSAGEATVQSVRTANQNTTLTFSSLASRTAGAVANFVATGTSSSASANQEVLTGQGLGFINQGMFYGGSSYAYMNAVNSYVRAAVYGSDSNFVTVGSGTTIGANTGKHVQITGAISAQTTISIPTLKINGSNNLTLAASQTLTLSTGGLLKAGNNAATLGGGTGITSGSAELVVRTDQSLDSLTISTPILSFSTGGLTKSGAGTLILSGTGNAYSGVTTVNAGMLDVQKDGGLGSGDVSVANGATLKLELGVSNNYINGSARLMLNDAAVVNLAFTGTDAVGGLLIDGVPQTSGTWGAIGSAATHQSSQFTGTGILNITGVTSTTTVSPSVNPSTYGQPVTFSAAVTGTGPTPTGTVTFKDGANILATVALDGSAHASFTTNTLTAISHSITATYSGNATFLASTSSTLTQTVNAQALTISANSTGKTYGQTVSFAGTEFTPSGLVNGDTVTSVTLTSAGAAASAATAGSPYSIVPSNATGSGLSNYTINYVNGSLTVSTKALSITANSTSKNYGQTVTFAGTEFTSSGLVNGDTVSSVILTSAGAAASAATAGSPYSIVPSSAIGTGLANYTIAYINGTLTVGKITVTGQITANDKVYDGTTTATISGYLLSGAVSNDAVSLTGGVASFADKNVSANQAVPVLAVNCGGSGIGNFIADTNFAGGNPYFTNSVIDTSAVTNPAPALVYQSERFGNNFTYTFDGITNSRTYTVRLHFAELFWTNVGQRVFNVSINGAPVLTNFDIIANVGVPNKAIIKEFTATANTNSQIVVQYTAVTDNAKASAIEIVGDETVVTATGLTLSGASAGNYTLTSTTASTTAAITPASLTVTANNKTNVYGAALPTLTASYTGFVNGENTNVLSGAPGLSTTATPTSPVANSPYVIVATNGTLTAQNYTFGFANGTLTVTTAPLTGSVTVSDKVYDGTTSATISGYNLIGVVGSDNVSLTGGSASFNDKTVSNNKPVNATGLSLTGTNATNYSLLSSNVSTTANVTARPLVVTATASNKIYDGTPAATASLADNRLLGDSFTDAYTTATFADKNVGAGKVVSVSGITITGADAANYSANTSTTTTATITPLSITGSITASDKVYDGTTAATISEYNLSGTVGGDNISLTGGSAMFADKNMGHGKLVSATGLTLSGTDVANYALASSSANTTASINARPLTISAAGINKTYDGNTTATVTLSDNRVAGDNFSDSYTTANFADKNVGTGKAVSVSGIAISGTDAANYAANTTASTTATITVAQVTGTITANNKVYDGNATAAISGYSLTGTVGGDNISLSGGSASFNDKTVGNNKPVTATGLTLTGSDSANYSLLSSDAGTTANITGHSLTVTASASDKVYDDTTAVTVSLSDNRVPGDSFTDTYTSASFADKNAAVGKTVGVTGIAISGTDAGNYLANTATTTTATITPAPISGSITASDKVYDSTVSATINGYSLTGTIGSDSVSLTGGSATFADKNVSSGDTVPVLAVNAGGPDVGNFIADTNFVGGSTFVANAVIDTSAVTNPAPASVYESERFGQNFTYTFSDISTARTYTVRLHFAELFWTNAGQRVFNVSINGTPVLTNFDIIADAGVIDKATIKEFAATANTNGQIVVQYIAVVDNAKASAIEIASDATVVTATGLTLTGPDAGNYALTSTTANTTAAITPAPLTVTADNQTMVYGTTVPVLTASYTGFVGSENTNVLSGAPILSTTATATSPVIGSPYTIVVSNGTLSAENYSFGFIDGTLTITAAPLTGSITASDKTYDGTTTATISGYNLSGVVGADDVSLTGGSASFNDKNAGSNKPVTATGLALTGAKASDYSLASASASTTASIDTRPLVVSATGINKAYDATVTATVTLADDRVLGDSFSDSYTTASFSDKNAGIGKAVSVGGIAISGTDAGNYAVNTTASTTATISTASVSGSVTASDKVYDGTAAATINGYSLSGVIGSDSVALTGGTANFFDKNVGHAKSVSATGLSLSGGDAGNYSLASSSANTTASITAASLTVTADNKSRPYGQSNPTFTASYTGFASGDDTNVLSGAPALSTTAVTNSATGGYPITAQIGTLSAANYSFALVNGTLSIGKAVITVTANDQSRPYGATNPVLTVTYTGFLDGDNTNVLFGLPSVTTIADTNSTVATGPYVISATNGTLVATNYNFAFVSGSLTVTPVVVTVTANNQTMVYGTTLPTFTANYTGFVNGENTNVLSGTPNLSTAATPTSPVVGSPYAIVATNGTLAATGNNYSFAFANGTLSITAASITGSITVSDKTYDGTTAATISGYSLIGTVIGDNVSLTGGSASFNDKTVGHNKPVTATSLSLTGTNASNYSLASSTASTTASINALSLVGSITASNKVYDGSATATISGYSLTGTIGGDNVSLTGGSASFNDKTVANNKPVTATGLTLTGSDSANYSLFSSSASTTASILGHSLTITASASDKVYNGNATAAVTLSDNRLLGDSFTDTYTSATFADKNVASGKTVSVTGIAISGTDAANYLANTTASTTAAITRALISGAVTASDKVYDGTTTAAINTYSLSGAVGGDNVSLTGGSATFADKNVSSGTTVPVLAVNAGGPTVGNFIADTNFVGGSSYATNSVINTSAVTNPAPMAVYQTERYGNSFAYTFNGFSMARTYIVRLHFAELYWTNVGQRIFNVSINGTTVLTNFDIIASAGAENKATIKEFTATANTNGQIIVQYSAVVDNAKASAIEIASDATLVTATGLTLTGTDAGNYTLASSTASTAAAITPAPLTVTANNQTAVYGTSIPALTASYTGFVGGENTNVISGAPVLSTAATATSPVVGSPYSIIVSNGTLSATNYSFGFVTGTLTITPATLTGGITASNKTYDGTTVATISGYSLSGVVGTDDVSLTGGSASFGDKNVGSNKPVTATGLTLTGAKASDYSLLSSNASTTASISTRSLAVSATGINKTYDTTVAVTVTLSDNRVAGDSFTDSYTTASFADKNVAIGKAVSVGGITISGTDSANYTANTTTSTTATISTASISGSITANDKVYDGTTAATISSHGLSGVIGSDSVTLTGGSANFVDKNVGHNKSVTATGFTLSGTDAGNYTLAPASASTTASISGAPLTVTADNKSKTAGLPNPQLTASYNGFVNGEDPTVFTIPVNLSTTATTNSPAGLYPITASNGIAPNYTISYFLGTLTCVPVPALTDVHLNGNQYSFSFVTLSTELYQVEYKTNMTDATWMNLGSPLPGTGGSVSSTNSVVGRTGFFRVEVMPGQ